MADELELASAPHALGLALSGGGSRAAAFHRGTLIALRELDVVERVEVLSTVSGGSLFGAAWQASRVREQSEQDFLDELGRELQRGFVGRSLLRSWRVPFPGPRNTRTEALADCLDDIFFRGMTLAQLPTRPRLCINSSLMNTGTVAKFSRAGLRAPELQRGRASSLIPMDDFPIARAVAASAAYPAILPPMSLSLRELEARHDFVADALPDNTRKLLLTDGGVLENLGVKSLLSGPFAAWNLIVSDAGACGDTWHDNWMLDSLIGLLLWLFSGRTVARVMIMMNSTQDAWARKQLFEELDFSHLREAHFEPEIGGRPSFRARLERRPQRPRRRILYTRLNNYWDRFITRLPRSRLLELVNEDLDALPPAGASVAELERFLTKLGVELGPAREHYAAMGGDATVDRLRAIPTNFTGLDEAEVLEPIIHHAAWQLHLSHAIFGDV